VTNRVLVVEDSQVIQRLIEVCLRPAGFDVEMRLDGPSGLAAVGEIQPDLVILDVGLPGMSGWEVLSSIRSDPATQNVIVMMLTGEVHESVKREAAERGANAYLSKPFRPQELREMATSLAGPSMSPVRATS
jgi:two-component system phosphate regulon response regulator PhoB